MQILTHHFLRNVTGLSLLCLWVLFMWRNGVYMVIPISFLGWQMQLPLSLLMMGAFIFGVLFFSPMNVFLFSKSSFKSTPSKPLKKPRR